ncbi:MAG: Mpo1-like protein [Pyrinomonadaceae bacterium]
MSQQEMQSFAEFWPYYLAEHSHKGTRLLHAAGTITSTTLAVALIASNRRRWLPVALLTGYAAAWVGHFFIEHNRPATFKHPLWSFAADYKMVALMLAGKLRDEG